MPSKFVIDVDKKIVYSHAVDPVGYTDLLRHMDRLLADGKFSPEFAQIADFRDVGEDAEISADDVKRLAKRNIYGPNSRRAFVISDKTLSGLGQMFARLRAQKGEPNVRVVKSLEEAADWVRVQPDEAETALKRLRPKAKRAD